MPVNYYGSFHHRSFVKDPALGCVTSASVSTFLSEIGTIFIRGGQTIADIVVIGVTWKATYQARSEGSTSSLLGVMFRNGTLYFIVLLVLNVLHIIFIFLPNSVFHVPLTNSSYVVWISEPLTAILVSRFMLDLHETHRILARQNSAELDLPTIRIMSLDVGEPYSREPGCENSEGWSPDASNLNLSCAEPEGGSSPRANSSITGPYENIENV